LFVVSVEIICRTNFLFICFVGGNLPDSYVPGGVISPASFLKPNLPPQSGQNLTAVDSLRNTFVSLQGSGDKHLTAGHIGARRQHDKSEQIQFLQNVHFPERQQNQTVAQEVVCIKKQIDCFL
jgi:hypothetical protein